MRLRKFFITVAAIASINFMGFTQTESEQVRHVADGSILHCWCWSFNTIKDNMSKIAEAGFTALQTSPINTCFIGEYGELNYWSDDLTGRWYYHYQPTDWKIGNYQLGTRDEFAAMCEEAKRFNITVIVDVVPNHTTQLTKYSRDQLQNLIDAVGGEDQLYHENDSKNVTNWNSRNELTTYRIGGCPDVNTENPKFQSYFMDFMNDAIDLGAGGFRFDTAKHIGLPGDPLDPKSKENDFWPIFTGSKSIDGKMLHNAENLFEYGEVLQGSGDRINDYAKIMRVTSSTYGGDLRLAVRLANLSGPRVYDYKNPAAPDRLVTWIESHDTYANQGESAKFTNFQLRVGYSILAARKYGTPLFFNRPQGEEATQFPGKTKIGSMGNNEFFNPEIVAVHGLRKACLGEDEKFLNPYSKSTLVLERGTKGTLLVNMEEKAVMFKYESQMPDGVYVDKAHGAKFTVKDGMLSGRVPKQSVCVIY